MLRQFNPRFFLIFVGILIGFYCQLWADPLAVNSGPGMKPPETVTELNWDGWFTMAVLILMFIALIREVRPPDIVMVVAAGVLTVGGAISPTQLLIGFSNDVIVTIALLCIVVRAWQANGLLTVFQNYVLPKTDKYFKQMILILTPVAALSAFMNNTVIVLMMTPVLRSWALKKHLSPSKFLIPLSYASIVGGALHIDRNIDKFDY